MIYPDGLSNLRISFVPSTRDTTTAKVTINCDGRHPNFKQNHMIAEAIIDEVQEFVNRNGDVFIEIDKIFQKAISDNNLR